MGNSQHERVRTPIEADRRPTLKGMRRAVWFLAAVAIAVVVAIGLLQASGDAPQTPKASFDANTALAQLEGAPAPLAALHVRANELVDGGVGAFEAQLKKLRGYPVVISKWGSWCGPCRAEFPVFQRVAARKGKSVAFLGINGQDPTDEAEAFLAEFPLSFPSYVDKGGGEPVATAVDAAGPFPITIFVDRKGEIEIVLAKPYGTVAELEADIKLYLRA